MQPTKNDLPETVRSKMIDLLGARLADAIDLQTQCKQAHWNVKGPKFFSLHQLFDQINEDAEEYVDLIAERAIQLGGQVEGTARVVARRSTLPEYPERITSGTDHVRALSTVLGTFGRSARAAIQTADQGGDANTADIFTEISRGVDKWLWMVEAHLQAET